MNRKNRRMVEWISKMYGSLEKWMDDWMDG